MENKVDNGESGRRRFIRRLTTLGAAGGIATILYGRVTEKPLIQLAQAASGEYLSMDNINTAAGTTELDSTIATGPVFEVWAKATSADPGNGPTSLYGRTDVAGGSVETGGPYPNAIEGYASATSGLTSGVYGHVISPAGVGVAGVSDATDSGTGVYGWARTNSPSSGAAIGVYGRSDSPDGYGTYGIATATSGVDVGMTPHGVYGQVDADGGTWIDGPWPRGVEGYAAGSSGAGSGVYGHTDMPAADGVTGIAPYSGVYGEATATTGYGSGIWGKSDSPDGPGVYGEGGPGVEGETNLSGAIGVVGRALATDGDGMGVRGRAFATEGIGVHGWASATSGVTEGMAPTGVLGTADAPGGVGDVGPWPTGVEGHATGTSGTTTGVWGHADSPLDGVGVEGGGGWCGVLAHTAASNGIAMFGRAQGPTVRPIVARASSGQTAALQEWQRSDRTVLTAIDKNGWLGLGTSAPARMLHLRGTNAVARMDRNDSPAFMLVRTSADFNTVWKCFVFGAQATGVNNGSFYIADMGTNVGGAGTYRLFIDNTGNFGVGTASPTDLLDVNGNAIRVRTSKTPASKSATGNQGEVCWDSNYVYVCVATNTWKRALLSSW